MAHHKSAIKRIKTNQKANESNRHYKSMMKTALKKVFENPEKENLEGNAKEAVSMLDKLARKGIIHKNKAANQKSRIARFLNSQ